MYITQISHYGLHLFGSSEGGHKAAATNRSLYGKDFYERIGRKGGKISRGGGFASSAELAARAGRIGGQRSRGGGRKRKLEAYA